MEENGQRLEKLSYAERLAAAMQSMKGTPLPADFDELDTPLRAEIVDELHRRLRKSRGGMKASGISADMIGGPALRSVIAGAAPEEEADLSGPAQTDERFEELTAYLGGHIHGDTHGAELHSARLPCRVCS